MGLIYSSSDSENLISGLRANIDSAKVALEDLVSASQRLTSSIGAEVKPWMVLRLMQEKIYFQH